MFIIRENKFLQKCSTLSYNKYRIEVKVKGKCKGKGKGKR